MTDQSLEHESGTQPEVEHLRAQVRQLQQERDAAYAMLNGLEQLSSRLSFWDGTPDRLSDLVEHIRQTFGYRIVALSLYQVGILYRCVIAPEGAQVDWTVSPEALEQAVLERNPFILSERDRHCLIVPLVIGIQRVGILELCSHVALTLAWRNFWRAMGPQVASLIAGGQLLAQLEAARHRHQLLYEITRHLTSRMNMDKVLTDILSLTIPYVDADDGSIMLLNDQMQVVNHILVRKQLSAQEQHQAIGRVLEDGLARWVIENKQATFVTDTSTDERWIHLPDDPGNVRSALAVPLQRGEQIRGLLFLVHHEPNHFNQDHLSFVSSVADQAAITAENIFLLEQTRRRVVELAALNEISEAASSLHLDDVLRIVAELTSQALQAKRCAIFLLDEPGARLSLRAVSYPEMAKDAPHLLAPSIHSLHIVESIQIRQPVQIPNIFADERFSSFWDQARELDIKVQLAVPLISKQRVIGAISLDRSSSHAAFSRNEIELCDTIAHQAANAIENARLYEELQRRAERLSLVNMVSHDIGALLDIDQLLWEVVRLIRETFDCYHVSIALIEGDRLVFRSNINYLYQSVPSASLSLAGEGEGVTGWVARHGRPLLIPDVSQDPHYRMVKELPDTRSELAVPLKVPTRAYGEIVGQETVIGVLNVESTEVSAFSLDDQDMLEALAAQVSVAIEGARLFGRVREERATLEALMSGTRDAIIVTDAQGRILFFNPAAKNAFTGGQEVQAGSLLSEVVHNEPLLELWNRAGQTGSLSAEIPLPDGRTLYGSMSLVPEVGRVIVMQDITYLKEMDEIKSNFVSTVSHDLRSPLQGIQTSAELLPKLGELNHEQRKEVEHILAVVRRISALVQHLLDIGRIEAGVGMEIEPCSVNEIVARTVSSLRSQAERKGIELVVELPKVLPLVKGNALRLEQVFNNLASNAIKFTPAGSVTITAFEEDGYVVIEVRDTGIGIPMEAQENLFQKFYRVKVPETRGIEGTGLGLAIVKSIVESYGGQVAVTSFPRLGSTFTVRLPTCRESERV